MEHVALVILLALLEYQFFSFKVGMARGKYDIKAPAISGHEVFDRYYRVHMNTLEQLIVFIPAILVFAYFGNPMYAAGLGAFYLVGRIIYFVSYVNDPAKRGLGFIIGWIPTVLLILGGLVSVALQIFR
jgi:glutathione S-transferase